MTKNCHIKLEVRSVYGRPLIYPLCEKSKYLAQLCRIGTLKGGLGKTIPFEAISIIQKLGYEIEWKGITEEAIKKLRVSQ